MHHERTQGAAPVAFRFRNIGPVKDADLELGDLTIIAGRNNTGKTYLVYTLYGFLKMWNAWPAANRALRRVESPSDDGPDLPQVFEQLLREGSASFPLDERTLASQRAAFVGALSRDFSDVALPQVFSSQADDFEGASISVVHEGANPCDTGPTPAEYELLEAVSLSIRRDADQILMAVEKPHSRPLAFDLDVLVAECYVDFLLRDLFPTSFILSAERFGISLFYRELDFTKNQLVDMLQKMGDDKNRERFSPYLLIDRATSRYALPIKDNIDYTRSIPDRRGDKSEIQEARLADEIKNMMDGYYRASGDEIRFISKARGKGRSFNIPLYLASSSARGLSDLYFFLRHAAKPNQLLIIDEPESHLDTANQIELARVLSRFVRSGLKVLITTHSDYLIKEVNNLVMAGQEFEARKVILGKLGYAKNDALHPDSIRAYVAENGTLTRCEVDRFGIDMPVFDTTIDDINAAANELTSRLETAGEG